MHPPVYNIICPNFELVQTKLPSFVFLNIFFLNILCFGSPARSMASDDGSTSQDEDPTDDVIMEWSRVSL